MTAETIHTCSYYCERPECIKRQRDELRDRLEAALAQQPAAPGGEAVEKWGQSYRCGCFLGFPTKAAIPGHCPQHLRDKNGTALPLDAAPQQPAGVDEAMVGRMVEAFLASTGQQHRVTQLQRDLTTECMKAALAALTEARNDR